VRGYGWNGSWRVVARICNLSLIRKWIKKNRNCDISLWSLYTHASSRSPWPLVSVAPRVSLRPTQLLLHGSSFWVLRMKVLSLLVNKFAAFYWGQTLTSFYLDAASSADGRTQGGSVSVWMQFVVNQHHTSARWMENICISVNYNEFHLRECRLVQKCCNISICTVHVVVHYLLQASEVLYAATFRLISGSKRVELLIKPESVSCLTDK
jgi:hypothetical protein